MKCGIGLRVLQVTWCSICFKYCEGPFVSLLSNTVRCSSELVDSSWPSVFRPFYHRRSLYLLLSNKQMFLPTRVGEWWYCFLSTPISSLLQQNNILWNGWSADVINNILDCRFCWLQAGRLDSGSCTKRCSIISSKRSFEKEYFLSRLFWRVNSLTFFRGFGPTWRMLGGAVPATVLLGRHLRHYFFCLRYSIRLLQTHEVACSCLLDFHRIRKSRCLKIEASLWNVGTSSTYFLS